jgi:hypothetical protein
MRVTPPIVMKEDARPKVQQLARAVGFRRSSEQANCGKCKGDPS